MLSEGTEVKKILLTILPKSATTPLPQHVSPRIYTEQENCSSPECSRPEPVIPCDSPECNRLEPVIKCDSPDCNRVEPVIPCDLPECHGGELITPETETNTTEEYIRNHFVSIWLTHEVISVQFNLVLIHLF